jgi:hypothetical protein
MFAAPALPDKDINIAIAATAVADILAAIVRKVRISSSFADFKGNWFRIF